VKCRHCGSELRLPFLDLGSAPASNAYLVREQLRAPEKSYPLRALVCETCWLVQIEDFIGADELFTDDYAYFSSVSTTWLDHAQHYVTTMIDRFGLGPNSLVAEIAANDGYLLQYVRNRGIPCYGVEPTKWTADAARAKGIDIVQSFFGRALATELAAKGRLADLVVANNVLAHVPDINDFTSGIAMLLKPGGIATFEFPHLLNLVRDNQFDTIYHEHYSYLSLSAVNRIFRVNGLKVFDVEKIPTHGGSLRVFARRLDFSAPTDSSAVHELLAQENSAGVTHRSFYQGFQARADAAKDELLAFLVEQKNQGNKVGAYGAAAKGNTLLNFAHVSMDLLPYVVDRSPAKQGKYLPGSRIPIVNEDHLRVDKPDRVLILPWNLRDEIEMQLAYVRGWGGGFVRAIPAMEFS
jgi:2-polyprenyl-3-methyl-5-hydroxy-6-metoxy-1,4-benzoquinol methylase